MGTFLRRTDPRKPGKLSFGNDKDALKGKKMVFCKKCHKRVIEVVTTIKEFVHGCGCVGVFSMIKHGSEAMTNVYGGVMASQGRTESERRLAKDRTSCYVTITKN